MSLSDKLHPDLLLLTETHLTKDMPLAGMRSFQTPPEHKGGVWTGASTNIGKYELVRHLNGNVTWTIATTKGIRLHIITVYAPDRSKPKADRDTVLDWVDHIIGQKIMKANNFEYVLVGGDFNQEIESYKQRL